MERRRIDDLLAYLDRLAMIQRDDGGYTCTKEISECIDAIRAEFDLGETASLRDKKVWKPFE